MSDLLYRAVAIDDRRVWCGKWRPDLQRTQAQALRWGIELDDPFDHVWIEWMTAGLVGVWGHLLVLDDDTASDGWQAA